MIYGPLWGSFSIPLTFKSKRSSAITWISRETMYQNALLIGCGCARANHVGGSGSSARIAFHPANDGARARTACSAGRALQNGIDQIAHRIDLRELRLFDVPAQLFFDVAEQLDALHGVEPKIEFQIVSWAARLAARCAPASRTIFSARWTSG